MHTGWIHDSGKKTLLVASALSLVSQMVPSSTCLALSLNFSNSKKAALQSPGYAKLDEGSGPDTNDNSATLDRTEGTTKPLAPAVVSQPETAPVVAPAPAEKPAVKVAEKAPKAKPAKIAEKAPAPAAVNTPDNFSILAPLKLTGDTVGSAPAAAATGDSASDKNETMLKSTVTESGFVPKEPTKISGTAVGSTSVKKGAPISINDQAKSVNAVPIPLMESASESDQKATAVNDAERTQLADLWDATLTKSPDIQFVVQRLMPTSNPNHAAAAMMKLLGSAMFGAVAGLGMMAPNPATMMGSQAGASMIANMMQQSAGKTAKQMQLNQTECIFLYNMVRQTADKLVDYYRGYKREDKSYKVACTDLADLQNMVRDSNAKDSEAVKMEYTLRKQQRDIDEILDKAKRNRQGLVDLAGADAVLKLDNQLAVEEQELNGTIKQEVKLATPKDQSSIPAKDKPM